MPCRNHAECDTANVKSKVILHIQSDIIKLPSELSAAFFRVNKVNDVSDGILNLTSELISFRSLVSVIYCTRNISVCIMNTLCSIAH